MSAVIKHYPVNLRPMILKDLPEIMQIENQAYEFPWTEGIFRDCMRVGYPSWVYEMDNEIVGYTVISIAAGESHILNLCVRPGSQGQGIGKLLLDGVLETAKRFEVTQILLEVRLSNTAAQKLYHAYGFNELGIRSQYYPAKRGREDALILALSLENSLEKK